MPTYARWRHRMLKARVIAQEILVIETHNGRKGRVLVVTQITGPKVLKNLEVPDAIGRPKVVVQQQRLQFAPHSWYCFYGRYGMQLPILEQTSIRKQ